MTDIKSKQDKEKHELNWKTDLYTSHSMSNFIQQIASNNSGKEQLTNMVMNNNNNNNTDNFDKEESDSLSGYSDDENHKRKQRRYRYVENFDLNV